MKKMLIGGVLLALLLPVQVMAQSAFEGTWKVDINKVKASNKPLVVTLKGDEYTCNCTPPIKIKADGADHPVTGHLSFDSDSVKIVDDHTIVDTVKKAGVVVDIWKCVGSRRVMVVANVDSPDTLDQILLDLPIMKEHGQHVRVDVTPLRRLEDFAADLKTRL